MSSGTPPAPDTRTTGMLYERGWALQIRCLACDNIRRWGWRELRAYPPQTTLEQLRPRFICRCGASEVALETVNGGWMVWDQATGRRIFIGEHDPRGDVARRPM